MVFKSNDTSVSDHVLSSVCWSYRDDMAVLVDVDEKAHGLVIRSYSTENELYRCDETEWDREREDIWPLEPQAVEHPVDWVNEMLMEHVSHGEVSYETEFAIYHTTITER